MKDTVKKADFVLTPYMKSNDLRAAYQILNTVLPYLFLWFLAFKVTSFWLLPPVIILMILFSLRCFSLMHDCGHYSLFKSKKANRIVGFILGVINAMPQYSWSRDHAYHHKTNGDWERYRGVADFLSVEEFAKLSPSQQRSYEFLRHPLMAFPGGFFYLAIKPRMEMISGIRNFASHLITHRQEHPEVSWSAAAAVHKSKYWQSIEEFWDLLFNNIFVVSGWIALSHFLGIGFFLGVYSIVLTCSAAIFIYVFFTQHIFEGSYAHKTAGWDYLLGAVEGSSYLELPTIFKWFSADIGYHSIHHLSERIPNYHLEACHNANIHLLSEVKKLRVGDLLSCAKFILWEPASNSLISIEHFRQSYQPKTQMNRLDKSLDH
jgi:acyl-lipid omega-6 desaturase (Delta-12 desaturase)